MSKVETAFLFHHRSQSQLVTVNSQLWFGHSLFISLLSIFQHIIKGRNFSLAAKPTNKQPIHQSQLNTYDLTLFLLLLISLSRRSLSCKKQWWERAGIYLFSKALLLCCCFLSLLVHSEKIKKKKKASKAPVFFFNSVGSFCFCRCLLVSF